MLGEIVIESRFCGPAGSGNGGYTCGRIAAFVGDSAEVTLRVPPPIDRPLRIERRNGGVVALDGETIVAEGEPVEIELEPPAPPTLDEAEAASKAYPGFEQHAFPTCFVCGPDRSAGDGLRIFAGPLPASTTVAAPWTPDASLALDRAVAPEFVWASLDCPGAIAVGFPERGETLLGRFAVRIDRAPGAGEPCVVVGWPLGEDGRKLYAGTALYAAGGELLAVGRATWIAPKSKP